MFLYLIGEAYKDRSRIYNSTLNREPVVISAVDAILLKLIHKRAEGRSVEFSIYIKDMFVAGYDQANCETVASYDTDALPLVGLALREERKTVDKVTTGFEFHRCKPNCFSAQKNWCYLWCS